MAMPQNGQEPAALRINRGRIADDGARRRRNPRAGTDSLLDRISVASEWHTWLDTAAWLARPRFEQSHWRGQWMEVQTIRCGGRIVARHGYHHVSGIERKNLKCAVCAEADREDIIDDFVGEVKRFSGPQLAPVASCRLNVCEAPN